jgi:hypothetical protein
MLSRNSFVLVPSDRIAPLATLEYLDHYGLSYAKLSASVANKKIDTYIRTCAERVLYELVRYKIT